MCLFLYLSLKTDVRLESGHLMRVGKFLKCNSELQKTQKVAVKLNTDLFFFLFMITNLRR